MTVAERPTLTERASAAGALLMLAASAAALLAGVVQNWAGVLVAMVAVVTGVSAGWTALSRHGVVRGIALALAAASVALLVWGFTLARLHPVRIAAVAVAAAASVGCARVALRRPGRLLRPRGMPGRDARPRRPPRNAVLIMNPKSGGGKAARYQLAEECAGRGIEPVILHRGDDLVRIAEDAIARGADVIGMAGGDGSQALVAAVAARHQIPLVVVPAGTRNHFALDLGLDRRDVVGALRAFTDPAERRVDLAEVNGHVFVNNSSLGLYAKIVQLPEYREAKLKTAAGLLPGLLGPGAEPIDLRFAGPGGRRFAAHLILVSNDPYQLDHIGGRGTRERLDLGTLGIVAARIDGTAGARHFVALEAAGQIRRFAGWLEWQARRFEVASGGPVEIALDGEARVMEPPLVFTSRPGALRVWVPRTAQAVSPAARALHLASRATVAELAAIAAGHGGR